MLFETVKKEHVEEAILLAKKQSWNTKQNSTKWDLVTDEGERYPPKVILKLANDISGGSELTVRHFNANKRTKLEKLGYIILPKSEHFIQEDIRQINSNKKIDETTKKQLIDARLGQGKFRADLLKICGNKCAVTECQTIAALRASHIKPWGKSSNQERLDPNNGLLLVANLDSLFDKGFISFENNGKILISQELPEAEQVFFGLQSLRLKIKISATSKAYLKYHRDILFRK